MPQLSGEKLVLLDALSRSAAPASATELLRDGDRGWPRGGAGHRAARAHKGPRTRCPPCSRRWRIPHRPWAAARAATALGDIGEGSAAEVVARDLYHDLPEIRAAAAGALARMNTGVGTEALERAQERLLPPGARGRGAGALLAHGERDGGGPLTWSSRELREKATEALAKGRFAQAAESLPAMYCEREPKDFQTRLRLGDVWAKEGNTARAIVAYQAAAEGFAPRGLPPPRHRRQQARAGAWIPSHQGVQQTLARLYARKGGGAPASVKPAARAPAPPRARPGRAAHRAAPRRGRGPRPG